MKYLNNSVVSFRVKVKGDWTCEVSELPVPDYSVEAIEGSERSETYQGESVEYTVEVHRNTAETAVQVFDKNGKEIDDFEIDTIVEAE